MRAQRQVARARLFTGFLRDLGGDLGLLLVGDLVHRVPCVEPVRPALPAEPCRVGTTGAARPCVAAHVRLVLLVHFACEHKPC
jgi:hypothetical protein